MTQSNLNQAGLHEARRAYFTVTKGIGFGDIETGKAIDAAISAYLECVESHRINKDFDK